MRMCVCVRARACVCVGGWVCGYVGVWVGVQCVCAYEIQISINPLLETVEQNVFSHIGTVERFSAVDVNLVSAMLRRQVRSP